MANRFQVLQSITDVNAFSNMIWNLIRVRKNPDEVAELLKKELTDDELQAICTAAQKGNYPLSLEQLQ